jgi:hypothetical protein
MGAGHDPSSSGILRWRLCKSRMVLDGMIAQGDGEVYSLLDGWLIGLWNHSPTMEC